jgi:hypothetical protein
MPRGSSRMARRWHRRWHSCRSTSTVCVTPRATSGGSERGLRRRGSSSKVLEPGESYRRGR